MVWTPGTTFPSGIPLTAALADTQKSGANSGQMDPSQFSASSSQVPSASGGLTGYDDGGDIPDPGGAIPQDPDSQDMEDTSTACDTTSPAADPSANVGPDQINAALGAVMDALDHGRQQLGLPGASQQVAGNIPMRPAGPGGEGVNPVPAQPLNPVLPQPANPFGKRVASNDSSSGDDSGDSGDTQALATGGPVERPYRDKWFAKNHPGQKKPWDKGSTGYDDGGDVDNPAGQADAAIPPTPPPTAQPQPAPGGQAGVGGAPGVPPQIASYLLGANAMPQQQLQQLEAKIDPQGSMDPSTRALLAVASAGGPDQQFAALQGYRQKFDAYRSFSRAALTGTAQKPADLNAAVTAANQAYGNLPNGSSMQFAPAKGGVAVTVKPAGKSGGKVKGFDSGGGVPDPTDDQTDDTSNDDTSEQIAGEAGAGTTYLTPDQLNSFLAKFGTFDQLMDQPVAKALSNAQQAPQPVTPPQAPATPASTAGPAAAGPGTPNNGATPEGSTPVPAVNADQNQPIPPNPAQTPAPPAAPVNMGANTYQPNANGTFNAQTMASAGTNNPQFAPPTPGMGPPTPDQLYKGYDADDVTAAKALHPGNIPEQIQFLEGNKQAKAERQNRIDVWQQRGQNSQLVAQTRVEGMNNATRTRLALGLAQISANSQNAQLKAAASTVGQALRNVPLGQPLDPRAQAMFEQLVSSGAIPPGLLPQAQAPQTQPTQQAPQAPSSPLPLPKSQAQLQAGQVYTTARGPAKWDGNQFVGQ